MRAIHTPKVACLAITAAILAALAGAGPAAAAAADCQPFATKPCLLPFPSNLFTKHDKSSVTGLRVHLPAGAMPVNSKGSRVGVASYDRNDGFSPGSAIIVHVRGLDNAKAFSRTGAAPLQDMGRSLRKRQPIVLIDEQTGKRQLIWSELDANQSAAADINLLIHPGKNLLEGHTYVVALRNLRTSSGKLIKAPSWFERLRDGRKLARGERSQRGRYAHIFAALKRAGIARSNLYEAWDFTVASRQNLTSRMLAIRNNAFAQLGDKNLADVQVQGNAPSYAVTSITAPMTQIKEVQGTFQVPCYLTRCGLAATTGFHYSSSQPDATPTQTPGNTATALFDCIVPSTATAATPARISLYGHGLLGSRTEVHAGNVEDMAVEHNMVFCATDWWGLAEQDTAYDITALQDLNNFPNVVDRLQHGDVLVVDERIRGPALAHVCRLEDLRVADRRRSQRAVGPLDCERALVDQVADPVVVDAGGGLGDTAEAEAVGRRFVVRGGDEDVAQPVAVGTDLCADPMLVDVEQAFLVDDLDCHRSASV